MEEKIEQLESTIQQQQQEINQRLASDREEILERLNLLEDNQCDHADKLANAVTPSMLDERLAMATEPIWETLTLETDQCDRDDNKQQEDIDPRN